MLFEKKSLFIKKPPSSLFKFCFRHSKPNFASIAWYLRCFFRIWTHVYKGFFFIFSTLRVIFWVVYNYLPASHLNFWKEEVDVQILGIMRKKFWRVILNVNVSRKPATLMSYTKLTKIWKLQKTSGNFIKNAMKGKPYFSCNSNKVNLL